VQFDPVFFKLRLMQFILNWNRLVSKRRLTAVCWKS